LARTEIVLLVQRWPALAEISPQTRAALPALRFRPDASSDPLNSIPAQAYRLVMFRPSNILSPNPRLQRTPSASPPSPLSRKPFGDIEQKCPA